MLGSEEECIQGFCREPEGRRSLGGRWEDNVKIDL
jgi:hypothetical protein